MCLQYEQVTIVTIKFSFHYFVQNFLLCCKVNNLADFYIFQLGTGWRFKKRPGLELFFQQVGPSPNEPPPFELVLYTHEAGFVSGIHKHLTLFSSN